MQLDNRVVLVDKPQGVTSFAAVRSLRRLSQVKKAGHCGSLDPLATGLLVLCTGVATRVTSFFVDLPKEYHARVRFGRATDSYDADGRTTLAAPVPALSEQVLRQALGRFEGEIDQVPPMVSALKVQGRRLYELARRGEEIARAPRKVMIYGIEMVDLGAEHVDLRVRCGRGCYVRSIAHELGESVGVPAHLEALRRVAIGSFRVEQATTLAALQAALQPAERIETPPPRGVLSLVPALSFLPALHVRRAHEESLRHGVQPDLASLREAPRRSGPHLLLTEDDRWLLGLASAEGRMEMAQLRLLLIFQEPMPSHETEADPA
jgi:tRNA pseudouridine55 synthase